MEVTSLASCQAHFTNFNIATFLAARRVTDFQVHGTWAITWFMVLQMLQNHSELFRTHNQTFFFLRYVITTKDSTSEDSILPCDAMQLAGSLDGLY